MATDAHTHKSAPGTNPLRRPLPHRLRLLFVGPPEPPWALLALRLETAGCAQAQFDWEADMAAAMTRLRKATFDCVVVLGQSSAGPSADAGPPSPEIRFVEGLRGSGSDDPVVVILPAPDDERTLQLEDLDCELLVSRSGCQSRALVALIQRAVGRGDLRREVSGLEVSARRLRLREREEAERHLQQLREMIAQRRPDPQPEQTESVRDRRPDMVARIEASYQELLQTYVMMGTGNLSGDVQQLAELLSLAGLLPTDVLGIHITQVDALLQGLGNRSSRHVMARADLLVVDLMMQLTEVYRQKTGVRGLGDAGVDLMHAEALISRAAGVRNP